jgi:uncharacterized membrane protein YkoI
MHERLMNGALPFSFIGNLRNAIVWRGVVARQLYKSKGDNMHRKISTAFAFATIVTCGAFAATTAKPPHTKITMAQARATALKKAPGTVKSEELENEKGKWIYSFDIATSKTGVTEVNVDAMNGKIVDVQHENAAKEAAEKKLEEKEKSKH